MNITTIGLDIAKNVFQVHGVDAHGKVVLRKQLRRIQVLAFFANLSPCLIGLEACAGAHYWGRELLKLGHDARLISPQFVKPYVKGNKNDANDAEAICEAVSRPSMHFVPLKSIEQQDIQMLHRVRSGLVKERTAQANRLRGLLSEYGIIIGQGLAQVRTRLPEILEDDKNGLTMAARQIFTDLQYQLRERDKQIAAYGEKILMLHRSSPASQTLGAVPGIGPITATALLAALGDGKAFDKARQVPAWLGLVPKQDSSGGKPKLLGISKRGDVYLRTLLIHGARAVVKAAAKKDDAHSRWINDLVQRRNVNIAAVAVANKNARIAWALLARTEAYRPPVPASV
ncbi:IS110 family transposase [Methylobacter sp. BlB1]|uniref:IS110 family transposase n=1 Tax=Methylobacter sp. BlB1 TaxID=2785914 RepID=UPI001893F666|nr:IS110 family transposase [Methylobacter sp. BlB1]MBF6651234.1 IS110 family transposase [Methylobacter sp. BlB1]